MRYAVYGLLVLVGLGGLLLGINALGASQNIAQEIEALLFVLIGVVAIGALAVVMAVEAASKVRAAPEKKPAAEVKTG